jgi:hypothetical protein
MLASFPGCSDMFALSTLKCQPFDDSKAQYKDHAETQSISSHECAWEGKVMRHSEQDEIPGEREREREREKHANKVIQKEHKITEADGHRP